MALFSKETPHKVVFFMTQVDFMFFLRLWVWSIQALPNPIRCFPNPWILFPNSPNMYRKYIQGIYNLTNLFFRLILNLPLDSSPCFNMKINEFHKKTFSKLVFGYNFASTIKIWMYHDLFHVLNPMKSRIFFRMSLLSRSSIIWAFFPWLWFWVSIFKLIQ